MGWNCEVPQAFREGDYPGENPNYKASPSYFLLFKNPFEKVTL
jgi:hypothetical protein